MKIHVKREHITNGIQFNSNCCPVALAIRSVADGEVCVLRSTVRIGRKVYPLPKRAISFIARYDKAYLAPLMRPFSFTL